MLTRRFSLQIVLRVLLLTLSCLIFAFMWMKTDKFFALFNMGLVIALQVAFLIFYLNRINRDLKNFLATIQSEDANLTFSKKWKSFRNLYRLMEEINDKIQSLRAEYAVQVRYFRTVVEQIQTGLISFGMNGNIELMNQAAKRMLGVHTVKEFDALLYQDTPLRSVLFSLKPAENKLIRLNCGMELIFLSVYSTVLETGKEKLKIITFHNIRSELDEIESESWQKLIRVLNHEIMNSVAPIVSTISTLSGYFTDRSEHPLILNGKVNEPVYKKTVSGLELIRERSEGLKQFVDKYKSLGKIEEPEYSVFQVKDLFSSCQLLIHDQLEKNNITWIVMIDRNDFKMVADRKLFQQVLINLGRNAIESLSESDIIDRKIELKAYQGNHNKTIIQITDNGPGIPEEIIDQIFIPFYTTKTKGSGIGLSISRLILTRMGWSIHVTSVPFEKTTFTLSN